VTHTQRISLVCAGLTGILTAGSAVVEKAFTEALGSQGIVPGTTEYARCMVQVHRDSGRHVADIFRGMFPGNEARAQAGSLAFSRSFTASIDRGMLSPLPGMEAALGKLGAAGLRLCVISGFSGQLSAQVLRALGWYDRIDLVVSADDSPRGCPWPDPVLTAMLRLGADDVREVAVAGSTESVVRSGFRAGAGLLVGVLSGPHSEAKLRNAGATRLVDNHAELAEVITAHGVERLSLSARSASLSLCYSRRTAPGGAV
jgi:phosphoglycolate phosphatase